jgi:hypothetical protein
VDLRVFVDERRNEAPSIAESRTVVTLRKSKEGLCRVQSATELVSETAVSSFTDHISQKPFLTREGLSMAEIHNSVGNDTHMASQEQREQASVGTSLPRTQERIQLVAISNMVRESDCAKDPKLLS